MKHQIVILLASKLLSISSVESYEAKVTNEENNSFLDASFAEDNDDHLLNRLAQVQYNRKYDHPTHFTKDYLPVYYDYHDNLIYDYEDDLQDQDNSWYITKLLKSVASMSLQVGKSLGSLLYTGLRVSQAYQSTKAELLKNKTFSEPSGVSEGREEGREPQASVSDVFLSVVLDPNSLEEVVAVSRSAKTEDEAINGLMEVILGVQSRQGSSLTLDPVTIIAILTLAAYLLRAVYQILNNNNNNNGREGLFENMISNVPEIFARIIDSATGTDFEDIDESSSRSLQNDVGMVSFPGSLIALTKLQREGHGSCVRQYVCDTLSSRDIFSYSMEDILLASMGYWFADADVWQLVDPTSKSAREEKVEACGRKQLRCKERTLKDALRLRDMFTQASQKFLSLWSKARAAKLRNVGRV